MSEVDLVVIKTVTMRNRNFMGTNDYKRRGELAFNMARIPLKSERDKNVYPELAERVETDSAGLQSGEKNLPEL